MIYLINSVSACLKNSIYINGVCNQLYKDKLGAFYTSSNANKYIMCNVNYVLQNQMCHAIISRDPLITSAVSRYSCLKQPAQLCTACKPGYVVDMTSHQCVIQKTLQFTGIICQGSIKVSADVAGWNQDTVALCAFTTDSSFAQNSVLEFKASVSVSDSTAIGLFAQVTTFSNVVIRGELTVVMSKSNAQAFVGSFIGLQNANIQIQNCSITMTIQLGTNSQKTVLKSGGLVGMIQGAVQLTVTNCTCVLTVPKTTQQDYNGGMLSTKKWYSVSGGVVGHLHLEPTISIDNSTTTVSIDTTRSAGGFVGLLQGGYVLISNSISHGSENAYSCGGMIGEANAPGLLTTQTIQVTVDTVKTDISMSGTYKGGIMGFQSSQATITTQGTNNFNGMCQIGSSC
ncbi:Hypothetical_protein [Hexamita inflata]|uniref:Hypothetical_protein n=1 Tax=Hexamita inflata TaxID=28002 RepID=A0AA86RGI9_9EUKA|nr:Hypothetical protein HINF_LOCUS65211 [Hexamita inflata]